MGEVELDDATSTVTLKANIILYGNVASAELALTVAHDIHNYWNEPNVSVLINNKWYRLLFSIEGFHLPDLAPTDVYENTDPRNNYFRIEEFASGNISFVDGINSNTGYFKLSNLLDKSTTAAHEFGHTIGLEHPHELDIRGRGVPGIMYPRGTITDPAYQYDPNAQPLRPGGTMNPLSRKVLQKDIEDLRIHELDFNASGVAIIGDFTSVWHEPHIT